MLECNITLGCKGFPMSNTLTYWSDSSVIKKKVKESDLLSLFLKSLPLGHEQVNPDMEFSILAKL